MVKRTRELCKDGLEAADLVATFIVRRVLPLQRRAHRICDMSGHRDSTRTSTEKLDRETLRTRVRAITDLKVDEKWWFGMHAYTRDSRPPQVTPLSFSLSASLLPLFLSLADLTLRSASFCLFFCLLPI